MQKNGVKTLYNNPLAADDRKLSVLSLRLFAAAEGQRYVAPRRVGMVVLELPSGLSSRNSLNP
jgi:hypothetical protein